MAKYWVSGQIMVADEKGNSKGSFFMAQGIEISVPITEFAQIMAIAQDLSNRTADTLKEPRERVGYIIMHISKLDEPSLIMTARH
jgi:hypothetical protein